MWMPLSASRWILLLTLGVMMLPSESEAIEHDCCYEPMKYKIKLENVGKCWKQTTFQCNEEAYWLDLKDGSTRCIHPEVKWLQRLIRQKMIDCPLLFGKAPIFEVLDEDKDEDEDEDEDEEEEE